jgi:hypothetical protein
MTRDDLVKALEPFTLMVKNDNLQLDNPEELPVEISVIALMWIENSGFGIDISFDLWEQVLAELMIKHGLARTH